MTLETRQDTGRQIALITGGNKGLGYETARQLAERGCTVVWAHATGPWGKMRQSG